MNHYKSWSGLNKQLDWMGKNLLSSRGLICISKIVI